MLQKNKSQNNTDWWSPRKKRQKKKEHTYAACPGKNAEENHLQLIANVSLEELEKRKKSDQRSEHTKPKPAVHAIREISQPKNQENSSGENKRSGPNPDNHQQTPTRTGEGGNFQDFMTEDDPSHKLLKE